MESEVPFHGGEKVGPLGVPEAVFIFILALLLFGPKKLPELGRMFGKAMMEFRRASNELKATFDREMNEIERETRSLKQEAQQYTNDVYNYDSYYDSHSYGTESSDNTTSTASESSHVGASAVQDAESTASPTLHGEPEHNGTVAVSSPDNSQHSGQPAEHPAGNPAA